MQRHLRQIEWEVEPLSSHAQTAGARWARGPLESVKSYAIPLSCYINLSVAGLNNSKRPRLTEHSNLFLSEETQSFSQMVICNPLIGTSDGRYTSSVPINIIRSQRLSNLF